MKRILLAIGVIFLMVPSTGQSAEHGYDTQFYFGASISFGNAGYFYSALRPYGEWIEIERGFYGWRPLRVHRGWRPYMHGRWAWTDYGWYWVSQEPFGWAVFHYGRWYYDDYYGWIWIPDNVWGPAWVEWRYDDDYIGWSPLPPYARFSVSVGIRFTSRWSAPVHYWNFISHRHFTTNSISRYVVSEGHARRLIRTTRSAGAYEVDRDRVINRGIDRSFIERHGNVRIDRIDVSETRNQGERMTRDGRGERIEVFRPSPNELERSPDRIDARQPERRLSIDMETIRISPRTEPTDRNVNRRGGAVRSDDGRIKDEPTPRRAEPDREVRTKPEYDRPQSRSREIWRVRPEPQKEQPQPRTIPDRPQERKRRDTPSVKPDDRRENPKEKEQSRRSGGRRDQ